MSLPVLDQDSYQWMCSDWVMYAGELLRQLGYLETEPTGTYDAEFAAAVRAFQEAYGITFEENYVGPYTWEALGVQDPEPAEDHQEPEHPEHQEPAPTAAADPGLEVLTGGKRYIIYEDEVRTGGTISWRARNPGNIRNGERYGAYPGKKANTKSAGSFAVFPDEQTGFEAIKQVLHNYGHITVAKAMAKYAPAGDGANDPDAYARSVAKQMGVSIDTYVDELDDSQMDIFATAIKRVEGWTEGETYALDDPNLPADVQRAIRGN
ncbi:MAG TPA: peptidoglycan-binding protein [Actinophytocola sp.]|uniref:peptidoglycan-binding protein n=1 Tax=Actinophytocola sp. TaxID=1872138 RepID=UPI002DDCB387|nr:peptidoglycan-binding protein [Actinophytocola sp.]HEV2780489.1 peptidoglycan-binding protein [Actinophytocola sp.]